VEKVLVDKLVFELKLDFLAGMLKHDSKGDMDNNWWDLEANMDDYCCKFQTDHSCQCPLWMQIIDAGREGRNILPEDFGEMVRTIEEATHTSPSLEIVLGGWNSVGQDRGLLEREMQSQLIWFHEGAWSTRTKVRLTSFKCLAPINVPVVSLVG
jgi:hypothetical protein